MALLWLPMRRLQIKSDWPTYNGDYTGRRFSSLAQITPQNVAHLQAQWVFHTKTPGVLEATPVVVNGIMYVTGSNDAFALNAQTGEVLWHYSRPISSGLIDDASGHINRGVAIFGDRLFMETDNAHLLCLDSRSGNLIWDVAYADWNKNYGGHRRSAHPQGQGVGCDLRWRRRSPRFPRRLRCRYWKISLALVDDPCPGRTWLCKLAGRNLSSRRWHCMDARHL